MKLLIFAAVLVCGALSASAQENRRYVAETLIKRGEILIELTRKTLHEHHVNGRGHLVHAIEEEVILVEALVKELKHQHADPEHVWSVHHLYAIEEELLHHENRIAEELIVVEEISKHHQHRGESVEQLVARGEHLIHKAKEEISKHGEHNHKEVHAIKIEIEDIEKLIHELHKKKHGESLHKEEEQLARHERSLHQLIERLEYSHHGEHHKEHENEHHKEHQNEHHNDYFQY